MKTAGVKGGLVVHLGCGDGKLTAALYAGESYLVHGLDADPRKVSAARDDIHSLGLYGRVSVQQWRGDKLPYTDNLVRLLVAEDLGQVGMEEVLRVLCPDGVALVTEGENWRKTVKPWPEDIDQWTHYLHDPSNNAVAEDTVLGPPRRVQWIGGPRWTRDHNTLNSISSVVTAAGRIFFLLDEATGSTMKVPGQWVIVARDAFSGVELWRKPIKAWASHTIRFRSGPPQLPRLLVASKEHVYTPLELNGPISQMDSRTGEVLGTYDWSRGAEEIVLLKKRLLVLGSTPAGERGENGKAAGKTNQPAKRSIVAIDTESGEALWQYAVLHGRPMPETLASDGKHVCIQVHNGVVCLDLASGKQRWSYGNVQSQNRAQQRPTGFGRYVLVISSNVVLCNLAGELTAISIKDGEKLWSCEGGQGFHAPLDVFVIDGIVWTGNHPKDSVSPPPVDDFSAGRDLLTGEVKYRNQVMVDLQSVGHHHRCYRNKASLRYIMTGKRGIEMLDLDGDNHSRNNWVRGTCQYGIMPANGLIYAPPHSCGCYTESMVRGFVALAPEHSARERAAVLSRKSGFSRLQKGPAYGTVQPAQFKPQPGAWPMFRHDELRSGVADTEISERIAKCWEVSIGGKLSQPVIAHGKVVVSAVDHHTVHALDEETGKAIWSHTVGGRVDSPPAIYRGLVLFGSADGWVYCLRLSDGELVWRFLAAPADLRIVSWNQLESVWPVHGSVLVANDKVYFSAGRSTWLDEGIDLYCLQPATGKLLHHDHYESVHPEFGQGKDQADAVREKAERFKERVIEQLARGSNRADYKSFLQPDRSVSFSMAGGTVSDILVSDGVNVYLHQVKFRSDLQLQSKMSRHLFSTSGFLDDPAEESRTHWVLGKGDFRLLPYPYVVAINRVGEVDSVFGMMLAYDEHAAWSVLRRKPYSKDPVIRVLRKAVGDEANDGAGDDWQVLIGELRPKSILKAGRHLWIGGIENDLGKLQVLSASDGQTIHTISLDTPMVWDGMAAAGGRLYVATTNGNILCLGGE
ncbi:MAG: outer membrane protein assembly factor BamB family protein [Planctomycetota bacterium]